MKDLIIEANDTSEEGFLAAWNTLKSRYYSSDLIRAIYGGIISGDLQFDYDFWADRPHFAPVISLDPPSQLSLDSQSQIRRNGKLSFGELSELLTLYQQEPATLTKYDVGRANHLHFSIVLDSTRDDVD